jgi:hypothetical protein
MTWETRIRHGEFIQRRARVAVGLSMSTASPDSSAGRSEQVETPAELAETPYARPREVVLVVDDEPTLRVL